VLSPSKLIPRSCLWVLRLDILAVSKRLQPKAKSYKCNVETPLNGTWSAPDAVEGRGLVLGFFEECCFQWAALHGIDGRDVRGRRA
jgi:hypothetical protein